MKTSWKMQALHYSHELKGMSQHRVNSQFEDSAYTQPREEDLMENHDFDTQTPKI
jgi:hypothetical protein